MHVHDYKRQIWQSAWYKKNSRWKGTSELEASGEQAVVSPGKIELAISKPKRIRWQPQYIWSDW